MGKVRQWIVKFITYEFQDESGFLRRQTGKFFVFLHFVMGFFCLWLTYYQLNMILEANGNELLWKSGLETFYLVAGVFWGNIGWDYYTKIKNGVSASEIADYLIDVSGPGIFIFPVVVSLIQVIVGFNNHGWFGGYYQLTSSLLWISMISFLALKITAKVRVLNKSRNSDGDNAAAGS